jgi:hypothetical protein
MQSIREQKLATMTPKKGRFRQAFRLRWVFRFVDGKVKVGGWNGASNRFEDSAASVNKTGLLVAEIQTEDFHGWGVKTVFSCDGHDYVTAKWFGATCTGVPVGKWEVDAVKLEPDIIGLTFLTRKERVSVFIDGSILRRPHRADDKYEQIREHTNKGVS